MKLNSIHPWNLNESQATAIQKSLRSWIIQDEHIAEPLAVVARAQLLYNLDSEYSTAKVTIYNPHSFEVLETNEATLRLNFPPTKGLQSFRKAPVILEALSGIQMTPQLILCDGRGVTGQHSFGVASHVGLIINIPTIGWRTAPSSVITHNMSKKRGSWIPLGETASPHGALLRVHEQLPPIYVSHAHRISLKQALAISLSVIPPNFDNEMMLDLLTPEPIDELNTRTIHRVV